MLDLIILGVLAKTLCMCYQSNQIYTVPSASSKYKDDVGDTFHIRLQQSIHHSTLYAFRIQGSYRRRFSHTITITNSLKGDIWDALHSRRQHTNTHLSKNYTKSCVVDTLPPLDLVDPRDVSGGAWRKYELAYRGEGWGSSTIGLWMIICDVEHCSKSMATSSNF